MGSRESTSGSDGHFTVARITPGAWPTSFDTGRIWAGLGVVEFRSGETVHRVITLPGGTTPH